MPSDPQHRKRRGLLLIAIALGMLGFAFLNVPLFKVFCGHFGLYVAPDEKLAVSTGPVNASRNIDIMFSGVAATGLPVELMPSDALETVHLGQRTENKFTFINPTDHPIRFRAIHDIFPADAATHLALIQCFCFNDQTLAAHQTITLPVIYQLNAGLSTDVQRVSLVYTLEPLAPASTGGQ